MRIDRTRRASAAASIALPRFLEKLAAMSPDRTEIDFPQPTRSSHVGTADLLRVHPTPPAEELLDMLAACVRGCYGSAETCTLCADACLGERRVGDLTECIRRCLDCAAICEATARVIARQTASKPALQRRQLEACIAASEACAESCGTHAQMHEHCRLCRDSCLACAALCKDLLAAM
jgi:hypothetical protein